MKQRIRVNPYGISKSAKALSQHIGAKRLKLFTGTRFVAKSSDVIINWGKGKANYFGTAGTILNKMMAIEVAGDKLRTLQALQASEVSIPTFGTSPSQFEPSQLLYGRTTLYGHSGRGIVVDTADGIIDCPLYVEAIEKVSEYRAIVVGDKVVDFKKKKKRNTPEGEEQLEYGEHVWNLNGNYIFARNGFDTPIGCADLAIRSVSALGLDFGAVDIIEDSSGTLYVLEVNTAFGLEGTTIELVGDAIKELIDARRV